MVVTINRIGIALGSGGNERHINDITEVVLHHTVTAHGTTSANFENGWRHNPAMGAPNARGGN
jgi:hypothetical protein